MHKGNGVDEKDARRRNKARELHLSKSHAWRWLLGVPPSDPGGSKAKLNEGLAARSEAHQRVSDAK